MWILFTQINFTRALKNLCNLHEDLLVKECQNLPKVNLECFLFTNLHKICIRWGGIPTKYDAQRHNTTATEQIEG